MQKNPRASSSAFVPLVFIPQLAGFQRTVSFSLRFDADCKFLVLPVSSVLFSRERRHQTKTTKTWIFFVRTNTTKLWYNHLIIECSTFWKSVHRRPSLNYNRPGACLPHTVLCVRSQAKSARRRINPFPSDFSVFFPPTRLFLVFWRFLVFVIISVELVRLRKSWRFPIFNIPFSSYVSPRRVSFFFVPCIWPNISRRVKISVLSRRTWVQFKLQENCVWIFKCATTPMVSLPDKGQGKTKIRPNSFSRSTTSR